MKLLSLVYVFLSVQLVTAQVDAVKSDVYNWEDLAIKQINGGERRNILQGDTRHFEFIAIDGFALNPKASQISSSNEDLEELIIVREGEFKITLNGKSQSLKSGGVALISPGVSHQLENTGKDAGVYYVLRFKSKTTMDKERGQKAGGSAVVNWDDVAFNESETGGRKQFFDRPTTALSRLEMHTTKLNAGLNSHAPHTHPEEEVVLLLRGEAEMQIGDKHTKVLPGGLIFLDSDIPHAITNTGTTPCEYFAFSMRPFVKGSKE
ncbi:MAG TPA: cupin domain-containing protein [Ohtaekwangia sp.]|nr:cupin domain-containing protein [Ohtaekwangia sp.]